MQLDEMLTKVEKEVQDLENVILNQGFNEWEILAKLRGSENVEDSKKSICSILFTMMKSVNERIKYMEKLKEQDQSETRIAHLIKRHTASGMALKALFQIVDDY